MGGHTAVSLVVAIVLGLHSVAADCRVVGIVSDAPRISGNVSVADAPGILLEGHSQGVLISGHKSAKRIHLHALAEVHMSPYLSLNMACASSLFSLRSVVRRFLSSSVRSSCVCL